MYIMTLNLKTFLFLLLVALLIRIDYFVSIISTNTNVKPIAYNTIYIVCGSMRCAQYEYITICCGGRLNIAYAACYVSVMNGMDG